MYVTFLKEIINTYEILSYLQKNIRASNKRERVLTLSRIIIVYCSTSSTTQRKSIVGLWPYVEGSKNKYNKFCSDTQFIWTSEDMSQCLFPMVVGLLHS